MAINAVGQEFLEGARLLGGKFPTQGRHPATTGEGQQAGGRLHRQDHPGAGAVVAVGQWLQQVQTTQHLGGGDAQQAIALQQ